MGLWYSKSLFAKHGWTYPKTWAEMLTLCDEIKKAGIAPWTWQGKYPEYINDPLLSLAAKAGGLDAGQGRSTTSSRTRGRARRCWPRPRRSPSWPAGLHMTGSEALSHTEAQAAWCQGKAAFIPCGSWLESEQKGVTPAGLRHGDGHRARLTAADKLPAQAAVQAASSESFLVPAKAKNAAGGMEYLRILLLASSRRRRSPKSDGTLPAVAGATDGLTLTSGLGSVRDAVTAAGRDDLHATASAPGTRRWPRPSTTPPASWSPSGSTPAQWADRMQKAADAMAKDSSVTEVHAG